MDENSVPDAARTVLTGEDIERVLTRVAFEIIEANKGTDDLVLLGIPSRGYPLAQRLAARIAATAPGDLEIPATGRAAGHHRCTVTTCATSRPAPRLQHACLLAGSTASRRARGRRLVLRTHHSRRTGRPGRRGRPRIVRLAVLVDRGHRELPIRADHVGKNRPRKAKRSACTWQKSTEKTK